MPALYRKYRPQDFDEVVGQEPVVRTLKNAIAADQVRQAYLFAGPRGTGKTSLARILAKALNCAQGPTPEPDKVCHACQAIASGTSLDVIEMDAASAARARAPAAPRRRRGGNRGARPGARARRPRRARLFPRRGLDARPAG